MSESLSRLGRDDLQKFAQYLISELPQQILPTAQRLLDDLLSKQITYINLFSGAPDPTAGASINEKTTWWLDESQLHRNVGKILRKLSQSGPEVCDAINLQPSESSVAVEWSYWLRPIRAREPEGVWNLLAILRELFKRGDANAAPLLKILTEQVLEYSSIMLWWFQTKVSLQVGSLGHGKLNNNQIHAIASQYARSTICDEIVSLWKLACLNPCLSSIDRENFFQQLQEYHIKTIEQVWKLKPHNFNVNGNNNGHKKPDYENFSGFKPAMRACLLDWDDSHFPNIIFSKGPARSWYSPCPHANLWKDLFSDEIRTLNASVNNANPSSSYCRSDLLSVRRTGRSLDIKQFFEKSCTPQLSNLDGLSSSSCSFNQSSNSLCTVSVINSSVKRSKDPKISCDNGKEILSKTCINGKPAASNRSSFSSEGFCETSETDNNDSDEDLSPGDKKSSAVKIQGEHLSSNSTLENHQIDQNDPSIDEKASVCTESKSHSEVVSSSNVEEIMSVNTVESIQKPGDICTEPITENFADSLNDLQDKTSKVSLDVDSSDSSNRKTLVDKQTILTKVAAEDVTSQTLLNKTRTISVILGNEQIKIPIKPIDDHNEILLARIEALHAHGLISEASVLAVELATNLLDHPPSLHINLPTPPQRNKRSRRFNPVYHQISLLASTIMTEVAFLCQVLCEIEEHHSLAFKVGLFGLELARPAASTKILEVKLFHQESEIVALLKKIPLGLDELNILREKARLMCDGQYRVRGDAVLPVALANYIFDALVYSSSPRSQSFGSRSTASSTSIPRPCIIKGGLDPADEQLGFEASIAVLGMKANVSEADHPLLCEGTRKQRGELIIQLLIHYRDDIEKIDKIMEKVCDKEIHVTGKNAKPSTTQASDVTEAVSPKASASRDKLLQTPTTSKPIESNSNDASPSVEDHVPTSSGDEPAVSRKELDSEKQATDGTSSPSWGENYKLWEARFRCTNFKTNKKHSVGMASIDSSAPETTSSDNSPTVVRRSVWVRPGSDSGSSGESSDSLGSSSSNDRGLKNNASTAQPNVNNPAPVSQGVVNVSACSNRPFPRSPGTQMLFRNYGIHEYLGGQDGSSSIQQSDLSTVSITSNHMASVLAASSQHIKQSRYKNRKIYPTSPNQPSEAASTFMHELAKTLLDKAGGSSHSGQVFNQHIINQNHEGPHRNLHMCAFKIALYALSLNNAVTPNWLSRTYSQLVNFITNQAVEIGAQAINFLIDNWVGHLTPTEAFNLAERASVYSSSDPPVKRAAARLALSCLHQAQALTRTKIELAISLCKEQDDAMLEEACSAVENAANAPQGGVYPEVLFYVCREWYGLFQKSRGGDSSTSQEQRNRPPFITPSVGEFQVTSTPNSLPHSPFLNAHLHLHHDVPGSYSLSSCTDGSGHPAASVLGSESFVNLRNNPHHNPSHSGTMVPLSQSSLHLISTLPCQPPSFSLSHHGNSAFYGFFHGLSTFHSAPPIPFLSSFMSTGSDSAAPYQYPATFITTPPTMPTSNTSFAMAAASAPSLPHFRNHFTPPSLLAGRPLLPNVIMTPQHPPRIPFLPSNMGGTGPLVIPINASHQHNAHIMPQHPALCLPSQAQQQPHQKYNQKQLYYLLAAYRVGMLAMKALARKNHDEQPKNKYAKNPDYEEGVNWLLICAKELGIVNLLTFYRPQN